MVLIVISSNIVRVSLLKENFGLTKIRVSQRICVFNSGRTCRVTCKRHNFYTNVCSFVSFCPKVFFIGLPFILLTL
jgi:hypothetical protein